jgi:hypothetical protein
MKMQQQSIDALKTELATANTNIEQLRQDNSELAYQLKRSNIAIYGHSTIDEYESAEEKKRQEKKLSEDKKQQDQIDAEVDELLDLDMPSNEVEVSDPLAIPVVKPRSKICDEDACIFSFKNVPRSLSPVPILSSRTESPPSLTTLVDIALKNPEKAITSRDFCGNC